MIVFGTNYVGTVQTNAGTGVTLVTTGNLAAGNYLCTFTISSSVNSIYNIEILDAVDAVQQTIVVRVAANDNLKLSLIGAFSLSDNYEVRIRPQTAITGGNTAVAAIQACQI